MTASKQALTESEEAISFGQLKKAASYLKANTPKPSAGFGVN